MIIQDARTEVDKSIHHTEVPSGDGLYVTCSEKMNSDSEDSKLDIQQISSIPLIMQLTHCNNSCSTFLLIKHL